MKFKELSQLTKGELESKIIEIKKELIKHNAQIAVGTTPKSPGQVRQLKKSVARIKTILNSKNDEKNEEKVNE